MSKLVHNVRAYTVTKKGIKSMPKIAPFADPLPVATRQPNFACGVVSRISTSVFEFQKDRLENVGAVWGG